MDNKYLQNIFEIANTNAFKQLAFMLGLALSVTTGVFVYNSIQEPSYRPLDYKMNDKNAAVIADTLEKSHIQYKINETTGLIMVAAKDMQTAKYKLAAAGVQRDDSLNFSYLNEQSAIGESQFIENARYLRALENDLVKTITAIEGISAARIHIAIPSNNVFADEAGRPTASVFVTVGNGLLLEKDKIRSIVQIVASSVPGLDPKDVAITDQYGHYLASSLSEESILTAEHMAYQNNIQSYYEKRIESLINPMLGENKVNVRVHADIDFSQQEEANEKFDPASKVVRSEETSEEQTGSSSASGPAGSLANSPPTSSGGGDSAKQQAASSQGRTQSIKNYELSKSVTYKKSNVAKMNSISVAVVVDDETTMDPKTNKPVIKPISKEKLDKITELVKATIGYDEKRGDKVTVVSSTFNVMKLPEPEAVSFWSNDWFWDTLKKAGSIIFGLIAFWILYKRISKHLNSMKMLPKSSLGDDEARVYTQQSRQEQIAQLKDIASKDPNRVALVMKSWVRNK